MRFYRATSFLFPRHYPARMFVLCFGAVHIPLFAFLLLEAFRGEWHWGIFIALLLATLVGSVTAIAGIWGLLAPIGEATRALVALRDGQVESRVPVGGPDMAGMLLESVAHATRSTAERMADLKGIATTDLLTGLPNRRGLIERFEERAPVSGVLALLDSNGFKRINDTLGHIEGDRVLRALADRISAVLREDDLAARWGGDEFVLFFPDLSLGEARIVLNRLDLDLKRRPVLKIDNVPVDFAYGLSEVEELGEGRLESVIAQADAKLFEDKKRKRRKANA
ncbi:diguanylate cyclase [Erythrobacter vulgaris]|uniref:diguanylate cyclase n=1 Tax=Qipengyuania vulgaris TaxID=291985 RepID=A0A844XVP0_9SPHN|nr:GGDEF domain-containing protein [Qipengyuania vulgaris]MXO49028.1 diguanylate cyclase [Qipengyuania vulgaris]